MRSFIVTAFFSGMAVTVVELAAARLIAPYFGASLFVWTNVIGIILVGLAIGYAYGGRLADRTTDIRRLYRILGVASVLIAVTPFAVRPIASAFSIDAGALAYLPIYLVAGSFVLTILLFLIPVTLLGMTSPFLISFLKRESESGVGTIAGRIFAWGTIGSILGIFFTGLAFIPLFGSRRTMLGAALVLAMLWVWKERTWWSMVWPAALLWLLFAPTTFAQPLAISEGLLFEKESPYQYVRVNNIGDNRYLIFNEGTGVQSVYYPDSLATLFYYDYMSTVPMLVPDDEVNMLMIGLGGGTLPRNFETLYADQSLHIDGVEIDPVVVDVAREYFDMPEERMDVTVADGRMFLRATDAQYNLVILDAYAQQLYIPWQLATVEFFTSVREHLTDSGMLAFNVAATSDGTDLFQALLATTAHVFPYVGYAPVPESSNIILIAGNTKPDVSRWLNQTAHPFLLPRAQQLHDTLVDVEETRGIVMTDDRAPVEFLTDLSFTVSVLGG